VLIDANGYAYLTSFPSAVGYYDFLRFTKTKLKFKTKGINYHSLKAWLMYKSKLLNRLLKPPLLELGSIFPCVEQAKVDVCCVLDIGNELVEDVSTEEILHKIIGINEYSLPRFHRNPLIKAYDYFNSGFIDVMRASEKCVLESLLKDCKCYYLRCNDWKWGDLIEKIV